MADEAVSVSRVVHAEPEAIFALLADANRHRDIDGSGSVQGTVGTPQRLTLGTRFGMSMRIGLPYRMVNTVVEFDENRRIAWQTRGPGPLGRAVGGRIWRYELEPVEGGTRVTETWDYSQESPLTKPVVSRGAEATKRNMAATLDRIATLVGR